MLRPSGCFQKERRRRWDVAAAGCAKELKNLKEMRPIFQILKYMILHNPLQSFSIFSHVRSDRGVGIKYGPDVTTKFCSQNRLRCTRLLQRLDVSTLPGCQVLGAQPSGSRRWAKLALIRVPFMDLL